MKILSRKDAIQQKLSRYFTGSPCIHGHISERYTKTAGCVECVHPSFQSVDIETKRRIKSALVTKKFRVHDSDLELFRGALLAAAMGFEPNITPESLETRQRPQAMRAGMYIRAFHIFPETEESLRNLERSFESRHIDTATILNPNKKIQLPGGEGKQ